MNLHEEYFCVSAHCFWGSSVWVQSSFFVVLSLVFWHYVSLSGKSHPSVIWRRASCHLSGIIWEAVQAGLLYSDICKHMVTLDSGLCLYYLSSEQAHQNKPCFLSFLWPLAFLTAAVSYTNSLIFDPLCTGTGLYK